MEEVNAYRALWAAVLVAAIKDLDERYPAVREAAKVWIYSNDTHPQSFRWACDMLGIDSGALQTAAMTREGRAPIRNHKLARRASAPEFRRPPSANKKRPKKTKKSGKKK
jgi:hypothetical protein